MFLLDNMNVNIDDSWKEQLQAEFDKPYFASLAEFVKQEYRSHTCYPPGKEIFNAFDHLIMVPGSGFACTFSLRR